MSGHVLVTGADGLIGAEICRQLRAVGRPVLATDVRASGDEDLVVCDVRDVDGLRRACEDVPVDVVVHCGGYSGAMAVAGSAVEMVDVNVLGTMSLLELARYKDARRFVYASTASAYGNTAPDCSDETRALAPTSTYAATKAASEHLINAFSAEQGIEVVSLRICWVYGPRRTTDCVIRTMLDDALAERATRLPFGADFPRQYMHVEDAARALILACDAAALTQPVYNITGGEFVTLSEVAAVVTSVLESADISLAPGPDPLDVIQGPFDTSRAAADLGFRPQISLREGIASFAAHLSDHMRTSILNTPQR